jgi:hypothetical protein
MRETSKATPLSLQEVGGLLELQRGAVMVDIVKIDHMITDPLALETRVVVHPEVAREAEVEILQGDGGQKMANRAEARMSSVQSRANKAISRQVNVKVYDLVSRLGRLA